MHVCVSVYVHVCVCAYVHMCMCVCACVCGCVRVGVFWFLLESVDRRLFTSQLWK